MEIRFNIPDNIAEPNMSRRAFELFVLDCYKSGKVSHGQLGSLLGLSFHQLEEALKRNGVVQDFSIENHQREFDDLSKMTKH